MEKLLTIVVPAYNVEKYIKNCLDSFIDLSVLRSLEILIVDDGSTDERTIEGNRIINTLPHCRYIERKENVGRAAIRNFLAREAKYTWLLPFISGICWGAAGIFVRTLEHDGLDNFSIISFRMLLAALITGIWILFYNRHLFYVHRRDF